MIQGCPTRKRMSKYLVVVQLLYTTLPTATLYHAFNPDSQRLPTSPQGEPAEGGEREREGGAGGRA